MIALLLAMAVGAPQAAAAPVGMKGDLTMSMQFQPPQAPTASSGDDVLTIVARRTYRAKLSTRTDRATRTRQCALKHGFGLPAIDAGLCDRLLDCMARNPTRALVKTCMTTRMVADLRRHYGVSAP